MTTASKQEESLICLRGWYQSPPSSMRTIQLLKIQNELLESGLTLEEIEKEMIKKLESK